MSRHLVGCSLQGETDSLRAGEQGKDMTDPLHLMDPTIVIAIVDGEPVEVLRVPLRDEYPQEEDES